MVHCKPVSGNFTVQVLITHSGAFKLSPKGFDAAVSHKVLHRMIDESAALAWFGHPVNGLDRGFRQNNVDAFAHGNQS